MSFRDWDRNIPAARVNLRLAREQDAERLRLINQYWDESERVLSILRVISRPLPKVTREFKEAWMDSLKDDDWNLEESE